MTRPLASLPAWLLLSIGFGLSGCSRPQSDPPAVARPVIASFTVTPSTTNAGRPVQLNWTVTGASRLLLMPGAIDVSGRNSYSLIAPPGSTDLALQASNSAGTVTALADLRSYDWSALAGDLDETLSSGQVDGYSFELIDRIGSLFARAGGDIAPDRLVALASATKLPSAMAIMTLVDHGELGLDVPIGDYLALDPGFVWPSDKSSITLRMLLAHTSGLPGLDDPNQPDCIDDESGVSLRDCAQAIANVALVDAPGTVFSYGGIDFQIAAYAATLVSGRNWQTFFQSALGNPLGLSRFTFGNADTVTNPRVAGGAFSTAAEYREFLRLLLDDGLRDGNRVLSTATVETILTDQIAGLPVRFTPFPLLRRSDYPGYGLGVFLSAARLHPGSAGPEWSDPGLFGSVPWIDRSLGYGAVLLIESNPGTGLDIWDALRPDIIRQLGAPAN